MSQTPAYAGNAQVAENPGKTLGIVALIASFFIALLGLILGIVGTVLAATARSDIRRRGMVGGGQAKAALICGIVAIVLSVASLIVGAIIAF